MSLAITIPEQGGDPCLEPRLELPVELSDERLVRRDLLLLRLQARRRRPGTQRSAAQWPVDVRTRVETLSTR